MTSPIRGWVAEGVGASAGRATLDGDGSGGGGGRRINYEWRIITSEREARSKFILIYTKNQSMSEPAGRPAAVTLLTFERLISLEP